MKLYIKNMVCKRCIMAVQAVLEELSVSYAEIKLGTVTIKKDLTTEHFQAIDNKLRYYDLELMDDHKKILVEQIKTSILELFQPNSEMIQVKLSIYLSEKIGYDYTYLSNTFSEVEHSTIERFFVVSRIERVKQLMIYDKLSLADIAFELHYSSVSHLSLQFKKVTGLTPSRFRTLCESEVFDWKTCK